jgi:hypothetical protein
LIPEIENTMIAISLGEVKELPLDKEGFAPG